MISAGEQASTEASLLAEISRRWGYTSFRPLQREAMTAAMERRDSLVVLPTGGGKSLCYQVPALLSEGTTIVLSPLISLMKDQVDRLIGKGVPAAFLNSSLDASDRRRVVADLLRGGTKLLFVAPERFAGDGFLSILSKIKIAAFAIDEAHCISHWGHDFREDYRQLGRLKEMFPQAPVHAFTATATPRVRQDILAQLGLRDPAVLIGDFFRPNLHYRAEPRRDAYEDVHREIERRPGAPGIVYCIRRADVDDLATRLKLAGVKAEPYHAGMDDEDRTAVQDRFSTAVTDVVVATVAFGMGIDRADLRFVIHAAMPKSLEHYQQETGRAGRDGKPADCVLFHSGGDFGLWRQIIQKNETSDLDDRMRMLSAMYDYCRGGRCRHRSLVEYFGQVWTQTCNSCDVCTTERPVMEDSDGVARKILGCIEATGQRFGISYVADLLKGRTSERAEQYGHDQVASFGALSGHSREDCMEWIRQLTDRDLLVREGEYGVLKITAKGRDVSRGRSEAVLHEVARAAPKPRRGRKSRVEAKASPAERLDHRQTELFDALRKVRRAIADEQNVPAFMVFSDRTLRHMAQLQPRSEDEMLRVNGVGPVKFESFGPHFLEAIRSHGASARPDGH